MVQVRTLNLAPKCGMAPFFPVRVLANGAGKNVEAVSKVWHAFVMQCLFFPVRVLANGAGKHIEPGFKVLHAFVMQGIFFPVRVLANEWCR